MLAVPTYHPAFLLRSSGEKKGDAKFQATVLDDLRRAMALRLRKPNWREEVIFETDGRPLEAGFIGPAPRPKAYFPTIGEVQEFIEAAVDTTVAVDVETTGEQALNCTLICVGMASSNGRVICIPILGQGRQPYWTKLEAAHVHALLKWFFAHPQVRTLFHNGAFDCQVLLANGLPVSNWREDTMALHHVLDSELPHGLAYLVSRYLELPYYKDDVKGDVRWLDLPDETLRVYNLRDCLATLRLWPILLNQVIALGLQHLYDEELECIYEMMLGSIRGLEVDYDRRDDETIDGRKEVDGKPNKWFGYPRGIGPRFRVLRDESLAVLKRIAGPDFNPGSVVQLRRVLFEQLKLPVVGKTDKGEPSTNKQALTLLATVYAETDDQLAFLLNLARYRKFSKLLSTWVEALPILSDSRLHPGWRLLPVTGRFSSSPNCQNWPDILLALWRAGEGRKFVSVDLSQAEMRGVAYFANDEFLLESFEKNLNVHTMNCTLLFGVRNPASDLTDPKLMKKLGDTNPATEEWLAKNVPKYLGKPYKSLEKWPVELWSRTRRLAKMQEFSSNYGASAETQQAQIRAERDPDTDEVLFPDLELSEVEAMCEQKKKIRPQIGQWWANQSNTTQFNKKYQCPLSGRIQWYRGGFDRNEMLARPVQSLVASHMNRSMVRIARRFRLEAPDARIVLHVHDALYVEVADDQVEAVKKILVEELSKPFALPGHPNATLPPDPPKVGQYLDDMKSAA